MARKSSISLLLILAGVAALATAQNMTTEADNSTLPMTTAKEEPSTTSPATTTVTTEEPVTPPNIPTFTTTEDAGDKVCMILAMDATVSFEDEEKDTVTSEVPAGADISEYPAECPETAKTSFMELGWNDQERDFTLYLFFEATEDTYSLVRMNATMDDGNTTTEWHLIGDLIPSTSLGNAIHCTDVTISGIEFREYQFQPFAQNSGGDFGSVVNCGDEDEGMDTVMIIVISVVAGLGAIAILGGGIYCMKKRRAGDEYESV